MEVIRWESQNFFEVVAPQEEEEIYTHKISEGTSVNGRFFQGNICDVMIQSLAYSMRWWIKYN